MKSTTFVLTFLLPRLQDVLFTAIFIGAVITGPRMLNGDLGRHLTLGKYVVTTLNIPTTDMFSFTRPGESRPPYEWLAQVLFYSIYNILNLDGVVVLTALVLALTFLMVFIDSLHRSSMPILASFLTLCAASASSLDWLTRPHVFSFLFFALWLLGLEKLRNGEKISLWFFPALMMVWVNTHGGFILGFLAWVAYFAGWIWEYWRKHEINKIGLKLLIIGVTSGVTSIFTPDLWRNWQGVLNNNSVYILSRTSETMPPDFKIPGTLPFSFLLLFVAILFILGWKNLPVAHLFLLIGFALLSLIIARNIPFFAIAAAPILAGNLRYKLESISLWSELEGRILKIDGELRSFYILSILMVILSTGSFLNYQIRNHTSYNQFSELTLPVQAVNWIESHPQNGNMFNDFNWGGYLLFKLWPRNRVFIDSQSDFYGEALTRQYAAILSGEDTWDKTLNQYKVTWIIVPSKSGLAEAARMNANWQINYQDPLAIIFVRK